MEKRCLKCGKMFEIPEDGETNRISCPNCGCQFKLVGGTLIREKQNVDLGMPEENIEKRDYAPITGKNNGELVDDQPSDEQPKPSTGLFGAIKKLFGGE
ncbi:MAG: hypothetical protein IJF84_09620 [Thermoguttaceae bacterium]|nr:hypothetical protein [Thermoguttaceae bacterium]